MPQRGPDCKIGYHKAFNYILKVLYTGMQWKELPIEKGPDGKAEIHYTGIYKDCSRDGLMMGRWKKPSSLRSRICQRNRSLI